MCSFQVTARSIIKPHVAVSFCLISIATFGQLSVDRKIDQKNRDTSAFQLYYGFAGLGSNMGMLAKTIRIDGTHFVFTYEQNSYYDKKTKKPDTISIQQFRQSSIDSILDIISGLKDTTIREYNFCMMSGGIHHLSITNGDHQISFELSNTFHRTALKIAYILNTYLPVGKKLSANEKMIKDAEDCLTRLFKQADSIKKNERNAS